MKAKSKRKGNFPPLRFPEFKAEWKRKKLGEVGTIYNGLSGKTRDDFGRGKKYIQYKQIFEAGQINLNDCGLVNIEDNEKQNQVQYGDIFFTMSSETPQEIGMASVLLTKIENVFLNSFCLGFRLNSFDIITPLFARFLFRSKNVRDIIVKLAQGSTRYNMSKLELLKVLINIPDLNEQTKIASFLSLIDERISTQMKIIEEWEKLKKGMIDELFLQKLILKEFDNEWEEISIGAIGTVVTGGTPSKKESKFWGGDFAWVTAQDFTEKYIYNSVLKLTDKGKKKSRTIPRNSVLVTCIASIGLNGINKVECAINQQINAIICNPLNYYEFIYYAILANTERLKNLAGQTAVPIINKSVFEKFTISKPKSLKEQQKIASILSSFDKKLTIERQILTQYQNQKKYLLQNMFI